MNTLTLAALLVLFCVIPAAALIAGLCVAAANADGRAFGGGDE